MVSPRPSCISWPVSRMAAPPSWPKPYHGIAARGRDHLLRPQLVDQLGAGNRRPQSDQKPLAAQFGNDRGIAVLDLRELLLKHKRHPAHAFEKSIGEYHVKQG